VTITYQYNVGIVPRDVMTSPDVQAANQGGDQITNIVGRWEAGPMLATGYAPGEVAQDLSFHVTSCIKQKPMNPPERNEAPVGPYSWTMPTTGQSKIPMDTKLVSIISAPRYENTRPPGGPRASEGY
jgi:hypothetical protein